MKGAALGKPDVAAREVEIVNLLRAKSGDSLSAGEIYKIVSTELGDTISRPAYYKLLDRLVVAGKIEQLEVGSVRQYAVSKQIHATNRLTLDDVYEMLPFFKSSETMSRAIEAQQYYFENRGKVIKDTALALANEPAAPLFFLWIDDLLNLLQKDLELFAIKENSIQVFADDSLEYRIQAEVHTLRDIMYRQLSIPFDAVDLPDWEGLHGLKLTGKFFYDRDLLRTALDSRVFGIGETSTVLGVVTVDPHIVKLANQEMIVSGSDGSFHAGTLGIRSASKFFEDESYVVTFNNSVAYVRQSERVKQQRGAKEFVHSAPLTRQTMDDPAYKGMVLAPFMFPTLTESEYEHMVRTASDVVQMRVDDEVINGKARDVATGEQLATPRVHIRDGTITPQDRGYNHYCSMNPYGDIAREGIERSRSILSRLKNARRPGIYAGAVKSTQIRLFSRLINWYISRGSELTRGKGKAIDPDWDISHGNFISDVDVMTLLLASLDVPKDGFWVSCIAIRQFASLTDFYDTKLKYDSGLQRKRDWFDVLKRLRDNRLENYKEFGGKLSYDAQMSEDSLENDSYLYLLENADYASFYVGHTKGDPAPKIPRYEFMCSLRDANSIETTQQVQGILEEIITALKVCGFTPDRDHNFLSRLSLAKLVVSVIYRAHELAKHIGQKFENEYKSVVIAKLVERRKSPLDNRNASLSPIGVQKYLQRFANVQNQLSDSGEDDANR